MIPILFRHGYGCSTVEPEGIDNRGEIPGFLSAREFMLHS